MSTKTNEKAEPGGAQVEAVVMPEALIESMHLEGGTATMTMRHPLFFEWTKDMLELFDESGAVHFLELCCGTPDRGNFVVTIQRLDGKPPGQIVQELKDLISQAHDTMNHAEVFIASREKMHPDGQELYRDLLYRLEAVKDGKA